MTRIDQIQPGVAPGVGEGQKTQRGQGDTAFAQVLEQAAGRLRETPGVAAQTPALDPLGALQGGEPPLAAELNPEQSEGLMRAEKALDILERYEQALGDQGKSLKDVAKLVRDLDGEVQALTRAMDKLSPQDKLYGLLQEVAVASTVESIKFNRGDYLPAEPSA